jgi:hypothetical protein
MTSRILRLVAQGRKKEAEKRSITKPKAMRATLLRCQARSVRSAANNTRGSGGLDMTRSIISDADRHAGSSAYRPHSRCHRTRWLGAAGFVPHPKKSGGRRIRRRPEGRRLNGGTSGDNAPVLAGQIGVGRDRSRRREVEIALEG